MVVFGKSTKKSREINSNGTVGHFLLPILPQGLFGILIEKQILQVEIKFVISSLTDVTSNCYYLYSLKYSEMSTISIHDVIN